MLFDEKIAFKNIAYYECFGCVQCWWNFSKVFEDLQIVLFIFVRCRIHVSCFFHLQLFIWPFLSKNANFCDVLWSHWHIRYVNLLLLFEDLFEMCVNVFLWDERSESQPRMGLQRLFVPIAVVIEELCVNGNASLVTISILFGTIKDQCANVSFQQTHNQGLRQLFLTVSSDLSA